MLNNNVYIANVHLYNDNIYLSLILKIPSRLDTLA